MRPHRLLALAALVALAAAAAPDDGERAVARGNSALERGDVEAALGHWRSALGSSAPGVQAMANCNLGSVLSDLDGAQAEALAEQHFAAAAADPGVSPDCEFSRGVYLQDRKRLPDAARAYSRALLGSDGADVDAAANLATVLHELRRIPEAVAAYETALSLDAAAAEPRFAVAQRAELHYNLGMARAALPGGGDRAAAAADLQRALELAPGHKLASHQLAALLGTDTPSGSPDEYVSALFDSYAETFDTSLAALNYSVPELLRDAVARHAPPPRGRRGKAARFRAALDVGCGTGLCAPWLREHTAAGGLRGCDLSARMVDIADGLGLYDDLSVEDLNVVLEQTKAGSLDLVLSADVFVYMGDLSLTFQYAAEALGDRGLFAFTAERHAGSELGWRLEPSGRFSHAPEFLAALAADHGFETLEHEHIVPRWDMGAPVPGQLVILAKGKQKGKKGKKRGRW